MVGSFDQHVNLGPRRIGIVRNMMPAIDLRQHPRNTKRGLDLRDMPEADTLERQPAPGVYTRGISGMLPIMFVRIGFPFEELQVKERKAIDQLRLVRRQRGLQFLSFTNSSNHANLHLSMAVLYQITVDNATDRMMFCGGNGRE